MGAGPGARAEAGAGEGAGEGEQGQRQRQGQGQRRGAGERAKPLVKGCNTHDGGGWTQPPRWLVLGWKPIRTAEVLVEVWSSTQEPR